MATNSENLQTVRVSNKFEKCPKCGSRVIKSDEYPEGDCMVCGWRKTRIPTKEELGELKKDGQHKYKPYIPPYF